MNLLWKCASVQYFHFRVLRKNQMYPLQVRRVFHKHLVDHKPTDINNKKQKIVYRVLGV